MQYTAKCITFSCLVACSFICGGAQIVETESRGDIKAGEWRRRELSVSYFARSHT